MKISKNCYKNPISPVQFPNGVCALNPQAPSVEVSDQTVVNNAAVVDPVVDVVINRKVVDQVVDVVVVDDVVEVVKPVLDDVAVVSVNK